MCAASETKRIVSERIGVRRIFRRAEVPLERILDALLMSGEQLKCSRNYRIRRVGEWVVKESCPRLGISLLRHTLQRDRYRRGWIASNRLEELGVPVPKPIALVENSVFGITAGNALISEYLDGCVNVEVWAAQLARGSASREVIQAYLTHLSEAINRLERSGAYHSDLSGKNVFTRDGGSFHFIDLDGIVFDVEYTRERRLRNHVQLCDSFCDLFPEVVLEDFFGRMLPEGIDAGAWFEEVKAGQRKRRSRQEAIWRRQGRC